MKLVLIIILFIVTSCSSLDRIYYYKGAKISQGGPELGNYPEIRFPHSEKYQLGLTYERDSRFMRVDNVKQVAISLDSAYYRKNISLGPLFLPIIPLFSNDPIIDKNMPVEINILVHGTGPFYKKDAIADFPILLIETKAKGTLRPIKTDKHTLGAKYTYGITIGEAEEFYILPSAIVYGSERLPIPKIKMNYVDELYYQAATKIAP